MKLYYSTGGMKTSEQIDNIVESPFGIEFSGGKYHEVFHCVCHISVTKIFVPLFSCSQTGDSA